MSLIHSLAPQKHEAGLLYFYFCPLLFVVEVFNANASIPYICRLQDKREQDILQNKDLPEFHLSVSTTP